MAKVYKLTNKTCKRCHGKGWAQWGSLYGPCNRCGGETGKESVLDVAASRADFTATLARYRSEGEAAKAVLEAGTGDRLMLFNAKRHLADARKYYGWVLAEFRQFEATLPKEKAHAA